MWRDAKFLIGRFMNKRYEKCPSTYLGYLLCFVLMFCLICVDNYQFNNIKKVVNVLNDYGITRNLYQINE